MSSSSALAHEDYELQPCHDSNVCVKCRTSLFNRHAHSIPEGAERQYITETIAPRVILEGGLVCFACWVHTLRTIQQQGIVAAPAVDINVCVWCQRSLAKTRSHSIPAGLERNTIIATIYPREITPEGLVCYAFIGYQHVEMWSMLQGLRITGKLQAPLTSTMTMCA